MDSLASRYSSALFSIAEEENKIKEYQEACKIFSKLILLTCNYSVTPIMSKK